MPILCQTAEIQGRRNRLRISALPTGVSSFNGDIHGTHRQPQPLSRHRQEQARPAPHFSFSKVAAVEAYMKELRAQGYKPRAEPTPPVLSSTVLWKPGVNLASFAPAF